MAHDKLRYCFAGENASRSKFFIESFNVKTFLMRSLAFLFYTTSANGNHHFVVKARERVWGCSGIARISS